MPVAALRMLLPQWPDKPTNWDLTTIYSAAARLKVSAQAMAIRLEELGKAHIGFNQVFVPSIKRKISEGTGGNYIATQLSHIGGY
jgi:hypothetical protein